MSEPLPDGLNRTIEGFDQIKDLCKIDEDFIKNY